MARVVVAAAAYLGDVAPFLAVARRLVEEGHDVTFLAPAGFAPLIDAEPFDHAVYGLDFSPAFMHADPEHSKLMRHPMANMARLGSYWLRIGWLDDKDAAESSTREALEGADCVVSHPTLTIVTLPIARSLGIPVIVGQLFPMNLPTAQWTPPVPSSFRAPRPVNRALWKVMEASTARAFSDDDANDLRRRCGLEPLRAVALNGPFDADETVLLVSEAYCDRAPDWPPVTPGGFAIWDGPPDPNDAEQLTHEPRIPEPLDGYIDDGDPPVLVTLGTSAATDAGRRFARIRADLAERGLRSIVLAGNTANADALAGEPGVVPFAPMTDLLPRCRAAVVSGALGGVAASLSAGRPTVVHPQLFDQHWHGLRVRRLGVGTIARRVTSVAAAVESVLDSSVESAARSLADRMRAEDGPGAIATAVDRWTAGVTHP